MLPTLSDLESYFGLLLEATSEEHDETKESTDKISDTTVEETNDGMKPQAKEDKTPKENMKYSEEKNDNSVEDLSEVDIDVQIVHLKVGKDGEITEESVNNSSVFSLSQDLPNDIIEDQDIPQNVTEKINKIKNYIQNMKKFKKNMHNER